VLCERRSDPVFSHGCVATTCFDEKGESVMRRVAIWMVAVTLVLGGATLAAAHSASSLEMTYDRTGGVLTVVAAHKVPNGAVHYIEEYEVAIADTEFCSLEMKRQLDKERSVAVFHVGDLAAGTKVSVRTECNRGGALSSTLVVE
jgi:hypothetical protein